jgi:hypothetical protein
MYTLRVGSKNGKQYKIVESVSRSEINRFTDKVLDYGKVLMRGDTDLGWFYEEDFEKFAARFECAPIDAEPEAETQPEPTNWRNEPATEAQLRYLTDLRVNTQVEDNLTKGRASELISAAKNNELGTVGGWYIDGSN